MQTHASKNEAANKPASVQRKTQYGSPLELMQRVQALEEEELLQGKFAPVQRMPEMEEEELLQGKFKPIQRQANNTGLPDNLKSGVENLSGYSMDDVKVHYNSDQPAQLNAHAYAQGTDIHIASGQERHLPHEAWHVVQQKQGRVRPTMQMKGKVNVNDDVGLEREADVMGGRAFLSSGIIDNARIQSGELNPMTSSFSSAPMASIVQRAIKPVDEDDPTLFFNERNSARLYYMGFSGQNAISLFVEQGAIEGLSKEISNEFNTWEREGGRGWYKGHRMFASNLNQFTKRWLDLAQKGDIIPKANKPVQYLMRNKDKQVAIKGDYSITDLYAVIESGFSLVLYEGGAGWGERSIAAHGTLYLAPGVDFDKVLENIGFNGDKSNVNSFPYLDQAKFTFDRDQAVRAGAEVVEAYRDKFFYASAVNRLARNTKALLGNTEFSSNAEYDDYVDSVWGPNGMEDSGAMDVEDDNEVNCEDLFAGEYEELIDGLNARSGSTDWERIRGPGSRGDGQIDAMNNWNARGLAAYASKDLGITGLRHGDDWEWLHIRGTQLGGDSTKENLAAGPWAANSNMIPYENMIRNWANTGIVFVKFDVQRHPQSVVLHDTITLSVATKDHEELGTIHPGDPLSVKFNVQEERFTDSMNAKLRKIDFHNKAGQKKQNQGT